MTQAFAVQCPFCNAKGELADSSLLGQAIACPACRQVFMLAPAPAPALAVPTPAPAQSAVPTAMAPVPTEAAMALVGSPPQTMMTSSLSDTGTGSTLRRRKPESKLLAIFAWSSISCTLLVWAIMFLMGDQTTKKKRDQDDQVAAKDSVRPKRRVTPQASDPRVADSTTSAPGRPSAGQSSADTAMVPVQPPPGLDTVRTEPAESIANIPRDIALKLTDDIGQDVTPFLIESLSHSHAGVREFAAQKVAKRNFDTSVVPSLLKLLTDSSPLVRNEAAIALSRHGKDSVEVIEPVGRLLLTDPVRDVRQSAAETLSLVGANDSRAAAVVQILLTALHDGKDEDIDFIVQAFWALGDAGQPALPELQRHLYKGSWNAVVAGTLAQLGHFDDFERILADTDANHAVRLSIADGIGRQRAMTAGSVKILESLYKHSGDQVRRQAIDALRTAEPHLPEAVDFLEQAKLDSDPSISAAAENALAAFPVDPVRKIVALLKQLAVVEPDDSQKLVDQIGRMDGIRVAIDLLNNPQADPIVQEAAAQILERFTDWDSKFDLRARDAFKIVNDLQHPLTIRVRCAIFMTRNKNQASQVIRTLSDAIMHESLPMELRRNAVNAVPWGMRTILPVLTAAAENCERPLPADATQRTKELRSEFHRRLLSRMLSGSYSRAERSQLLPRFLNAIQKCDNDVKIEALKSLADLRLDDSQNGPAIALSRMELQNTEPKVRGAAANAIGHFGPAAAAAAADLLPMLQDNETTVVSEVVLALARVTPNDTHLAQVLIRALDQVEIQKSVVTALKEMGPTAAPAVAQLQQMIPDADSGLLVEILEGLGNVGAAAKPAVPDMVAQLKHPENHVRMSAAKALGSLKENANEAIPALIELLSGDEFAQEMALVSFRKMGPAAKSVEPDLQKLASVTQVPRIKQRLESALASIAVDPNDPDLALINIILEDEKWMTTMFSEPKDPATVIPALGQIVLQGQSFIRQRAWDWLCKLRYVDTEQQIFETMLKSDDLARQSLAAVVLERLPTRTDSSEVVIGLTPWTKFSKGRKEAIGLLVKLGHPAMPVVAKALLDEHIPMTERVDLLYLIRNRNELDRTTLLSLLREGLKSNSDAVQKAAALSLAFLNPREKDVVSYVLELYKSRAADSYIESHLLEGMAKGGADLSIAVPELLKIFESANTPPGDAEQLDRFYSDLTIISDLLVVIGPRAEDVPLFRQVLKTATDSVARNEDLDLRSRRHRAVIVESAIKLLAAAGPHAASAVPEINAHLIHGSGGADEIDLAPMLIKIGEPAIQAALEVIQQADASPAARVRAFQVLQILAKVDERGITALRELLQDPNQHLQVNAAFELVDLDPHQDAALRILMEAMQRSDDFSSGVFDKVRRHLPATELLPVLLDIIKQPKHKFVETVTEILVEIAPENLDVRNAALKMLREGRSSIHDPKSWVSFVLDLIRAVEEDKGEWRDRAIQVLGRFGSLATDAIPVLHRVMEQEAGGAGDTAALSLVMIDPHDEDAAARAISLYLKSDTPEYEAVRAMMQLGSRAAPILPKLIEELESHRRWGETYPLVGTLGDAAKPAIPLVIKELGDYREGGSAHNAIKTLGEHAQDFGPQLIEALRRGDGTHFRPGLLEKMGEPAQKAVAEMCADLQDDEKRFQTVVRLRVFGSLAEPAITELLAYAKEGTPELREAAIQVLAEIESRAADSVPVLATALADPDPRIAHEASRALWQLRSHAAAALPEIVAELERNRQSTTFGLLQLLSTMGPSAKEACPALEQLRQSPNIVTRLIAREALDRIKHLDSKE